MAAGGGRWGTGQPATKRRGRLRGRSAAAARLAGEYIEQRVQAGADVPAAFEVLHIKLRHHCIGLRQRVGAGVGALRDAALRGDGARVERLHRAVRVQVPAADLQSRSGRSGHQACCAAAGAAGSAEWCRRAGAVAREWEAGRAWQPASSGKPLQVFRQTRFSAHFSSAMHRASCSWQLESRHFPTFAESIAHLRRLGAIGTYYRTSQIRETEQFISISQ